MYKLSDFEYGFSSLLATAALKPLNLARISTTSLTRWQVIHLAKGHQCFKFNLKGK